MKLIFSLLFCTLSMPAFAAINSNDIIQGRSGCKALPSAQHNKAKILEFARNGSDIETCSSLQHFTQTDLLQLQIPARQRITLFIDSPSFDVSALQNLSQSGVHISLASSKLNSANIKYENLQYLAQHPTPGKVKLFIDSKDSLTMSELAYLSSKPIEMFINLEDSPVTSKSDLDRLSQALQGRLTIFTDGTTFTENELSQARRYGTHFKLIN